MDAPIAGGGSPEASSYYIQATTSIQERWPRALKHGDTFGMFDQLGDVVDPEMTPGGIFHKDMRYLSELQLLLFSQRPLLLSSAIDDDNVVLTADLSNPDIYLKDKLVLPRETLHIRRSRFIWRDTCNEHLSIRNFNTEEQQCLLEIRTGTDFADIFEVRGSKRTKRGKIRVEHTKSAIDYRYDGLDGIERAMCIRFDPPPQKIENGVAYYDFMLAPHAHSSITIKMHCDASRTMSGEPYSVPYRAARREAREAQESGVVIESSHELVTLFFRRAKADLAMLITQTEQGPYPCAGTPWFCTPFGRDGIITALQTLWISPVLAKGVLKYLASEQATKTDPSVEAQPGKILHEIRHSEMAELKEVPFGKYYGSVDATPLFVLLAANYFERTADSETLHWLWPNIEAALNWMDRYGDQDGDGFLEYAREGKDGLVNQGWKDSSDSIMHEDGTLAKGPIALCEVQGYAYAAKRGIADVARALGRAARGDQLDAEAEALRKKFEAAFWLDDLETYALALDGEKKPCRVRSSNAGQVLFSGIASQKRAARVAHGLFTPESFSGWGIRTLAVGTARYNPISYHDGSVWPHDNSLIALGLGHYGFRREAAIVFRAMFDAASHLDLMRLPELFCGFARRRLGAPTLYPVACMPQAWASAAPFAFLEACLGMHCDHERREMHLDRPKLPSFIESLSVRNVVVDGETTDLQLDNHRGKISAHSSNSAVRIRITAAR